MGAGVNRSPSTGMASSERFEIRQKIGAGGMGAVYRAYDHERKIEVAVKSLLKADARALYRFKREFRALADVVHPNLVTLYELHRVGDEWLFTMELVDGVPFIHYVRPWVDPFERERELAKLIEDTGTVTDTRETKTTGVWARPKSGRARIQNSVLDPGRLDAALYQLVDGVTALHRAGKLHRDLKPSNVLVEHEGRLVLLDFGLTGDLATIGQEHTHETLAVGTPLYMSPEQAADTPLTEASDWYSVGVMLYEALTGRRPFEDAGDQVYLAKQLQDPARPSDLDPKVPERLDELCWKLLHRDPRQRPTGDEILAHLNRVPSPATLQLAAGSGPGRLPFVGRQEELAELREALEDSRLGGSVAVFVSGPSGMGKSALVRKFLGEVESQRGAVVLEGRCYERESVPYKALDAVVDALTRHLLAIPTEELQRILPKDVMALSRLFPTLRRVPAVAEPLHRTFEPPDPQELRRRAFDALRHLLKQLALRRPVVLYVDDLQWGDADSSSFLTDLVYHPAPPALLMILAFRSEDQDASPLIRALRQKRPPSAGGEMRAIELGALPEDEAGALVRELGAGDDETRLDALVRDSEGSPLFLVELARTSALDEQTGGSGELSLEQILAARVQALDPAARELLRICAVAGGPIDPELATTAAGLDGQGSELDLLRNENLLRSRLASDGTGWIETFHDRVREVVIASIPEVELASVHRALAHTMERSGHTDPGALLEHWRGAGDFERVGRYAADAADAADAALAFDRAAGYYRLALEHGPRVPEHRRALHEKLGYALANAGRLAEAADAFAAAAEGADSEHRLELGRLELEQLLRNGDLERGIAKAEEVLGAVDLGVPPGHRRALVSIVGQRVLLRLRGFRFRERTADELPAETLRRLEICWSASSALTFVEPFVGRALQMRFLRLALSAGEPGHVAVALGLELGYLAIQGSPARPKVESLRERALELAARVGDPKITGLVEGSSGVASFLSGQWREALGRLGRAEKILRDSSRDARWELDISQFFTTWSLFYTGQLDKLARTLPVYLREAEERGDIYAVRGLKAWRSNVAWLIADRPGEAREALESVAVGGAFHLHHYYQLLSRSQIDIYEGNAGTALGELEHFWRDLKRAMLLRIQSVRVEADYLRARAALASLHEGDRPAKLAVVDKSVRRLESERAAWARGLAALVRAGAEAARGDDDGAAIALWTAIDRLDAADMELHATVARARLSKLVKGGEGERLAEDVETWMREQNVAAPDRLIDLFAPGW